MKSSSACGPAGRSSPGCPIGCSVLVAYSLVSALGVRCVEARVCGIGARTEDVRTVARVGEAKRLLYYYSIKIIVPNDRRNRNLQSRTHVIDRILIHTAHAYFIRYYPPQTTHVTSPPAAAHLPLRYVLRLEHTYSTAYSYSVVSSPHTVPTAVPTFQFYPRARL